MPKSSRTWTDKDTIIRRRIIDIAEGHSPSHICILGKQSYVPVIDAKNLPQHPHVTERSSTPQQRPGEFVLVIWLPNCFSQTAIRETDPLDSIAMDGRRKSWDGQQGKARGGRNVEVRQECVELRESG